MESNSYYGDFQSPLSVMPLKSDGSLCIMEALSKSHPKLEDFLGGATMPTTHQRDDAIVSLDSAFYNQMHFRQQQFYDHQTQFVGGFPYIQELEHQFANNSTMVENEMEGHDELKWTGRYEAHLWDNSCKKEGQTRKGRQGGYDMEEKAARAYDLAALKYWGPPTHINFPLENYHQELEEMKNMSRQEYVAHLRRHHQHGRWQARIGRVAGNKDLYLGTFSTQEEAAAAHDEPPSNSRAPTPSLISTCPDDADKITTSNTLPTGEIAAKKGE
ncbi:hypothetical protein DH2020_018561 [Rehmannia glutinosa]|uniref:AP2/ERF domain-containing protein n=1 Tax=Rehmannia glutinosa TaxID=99300 RepID=A0ABR0WNF0_REHGL